MIMNFNRLPEDIKLLIIEYVPAEDYPSLQITSRELYQLFQRKPSLWAKQLFSCIIQCPNKSLNLFKCDYNPKKYYIPQQIEFNQFSEAKDIWKNGAINKNQYIHYLDNQSGDLDSSKAFVDRIINILIDAPFPEPLLKKEIYYFPTPSSFQNFLTELFYGIVPTLRNDPEQGFLEDICKKIKELNQKSDNLINIRWYNFGDCSNEENLIFGLLNGFNELIKSHCNAIRGYLTNLNQKKIQLKEYNRCWKEFAFAVIELDKLMKPICNLVNDIYSEQYPNHPQFPEFSIWRLMVKLWYQQVYAPLSDKMKESYKKMFLGALLDKLNQSDVAPSKLYEINIELERFSNGARLSEDEVLHIEKEIKTVKKHLLALEDLSLNEYTVFYNDCENGDKCSPKVQMIKSIAEEIKEFASALFEIVAEDKNEFKVVFSNLQDTLDVLLDERSQYEVMQAIYESFQEKTEKKQKSKDQAIDIVNRLGDNLERTRTNFADISYQRESQGHYKIEEGFEAYFSHHRFVTANDLAAF